MNSAEDKGEVFVKRSLEIMAAFHHVLLIGPPISDKSILTKRQSDIPAQKRRALASFIDFS